MNLRDVKLGLELTQTNAVQWFQRMEILLRNLECWTAVDSDIGDVAHKNAARLAISCNVGDDLIHQVSPTASPKVIWDALKKQFTGISSARKMALSRAQASFRKLSEETLGQFITRAEQLRAELISAQMHKEEEFVLMFIAALEESDFVSWAQAISAQPKLPTFADVTENLRGTFYHKMHATSATSSVSGAYQVASNEKQATECEYCHKPGHQILQCFKLKKDQNAYEHDPNSGRGKGRGRGRGKGRGGGRGRGSGRGVNANQASGPSNASAFVCVAANITSTKESKWLFDSATTDHMVNKAEYLHDAKPMKSTCTVANKQTEDVAAIGTVKLTNHRGYEVTLKDVLLVPTLQDNLISLSRADEAGLSYTGKTGKITLSNATKELLIATKVNRLYEVNCEPIISDQMIQAALASQVNDAVTWHRRFGHAGHSTLAKMSRGETVQGLPPARVFDQQLQSTAVCTPCAVGKMKRASFPNTHRRASCKLERLHADIAGPFETSPGGANYYLVIVDDFSSYKVVVPIARKSDAAEALMNVIPKLEKKYKSTVAAVRYDRDTVFLSNKVQAFLSEKGIESQPTSGYSPQENGHAERAIGTLSDLRDALMADAGLKNVYWAEAAVHAAYLSNIMCSEGGMSPWERLKGTKPDISNLKTWGCTCFVRIPAEKRKKSQLPAKAIACKHLGYAQPNFKAYRVLLPNGNVNISRDVRFDESAAPASDVRIDMFSDLMETVTHPQPQPQQPPQQPPQPHAQQQQPQPAQQLQPEQMQQLMANNPLFDEEDQAVPAAPIPASAAQPAAPRRNPPRVRQPPQDPYQKYLQGLPHNAHVNFHL